jgi:hypothetical protein
VYDTKAGEYLKTVGNVVLHIRAMMALVSMTSVTKEGENG